MSSQDHVDSRYPLSALTGSIIAAAQEVHRTLGPGFEEVVYQRALAKELPAYGLEYSREVWIDILYKGDKVGRKRVDFIIGDATGDVMIEIKLKGVGLLDLDQVRRCIRAGEEAARQHLPELTALRDKAMPGRLARWWQSMRSRLSAGDQQKAKDV